MQKSPIVITGRMVVIVVNAAADIVMAADQIVAFGVLNR